MNALATVTVPVIDQYGSVFRLLRAVGLPFSLSRVEELSELGPDAPLAILGSYGRPDADTVHVLSERIPTVIYAVQVRATDPVPDTGALGYLTDRMSIHAVRDALVAALRLAMAGTAPR